MDVLWEPTHIIGYVKDHVLHANSAMMVEHVHQNINAYICKVSVHYKTRITWIWTCSKVISAAGTPTYRDIGNIPGHLIFRSQQEIGLTADSPCSWSPIFIMFRSLAQQRPGRSSFFRSTIHQRFATICFVRGNSEPRLAHMYCVLRFPRIIWSLGGSFWPGQLEAVSGCESISSDVNQT